MRAVGVDLGATNARAALVEVETGKILVETKQPWTDHAPETVASIVGGVVRAVDPEGVRAGVGVGFAGMLRGWTGVVVNAPNFGWREVDFRSMLRAKVGERCELYNDLNAIAYGEAMYGGARGLSDVLCVYVGTGVGGGLVVDGKLYAGSTHLAGEIGHTKVVPAGRLCGCGDFYAGRLWEEVSTLLGMALGNAVTVLNPSRLVMGGGVWQGAPELRRRSIARLFELVNQPSREGFEVVDTALGDAAGMLGAAALIAHANGGRP